MITSLILQRARSLLNATTNLAGTRSPRAAAWLARAALESTVIQALADQGLTTKDASMRSRLACLQTLDPARATTAAAAWWGLSRCYHHHAFELTPTFAEVSHLVGLSSR